MRIKSLIFALLAFVATSWALTAQSAPKGKKVLIAYYSLRNGNTRLVAEEIQKRVGGDIFRIETVQTYPDQYRAVTEQAKKELEAGARPKLKGLPKDLGSYDVIFLGSPNWWSTIAPAVFTFLESDAFAGKTIVPFITHEGSRLGNSVSDIIRTAPKAKVAEGLAIRGGSASKSGADVEKWLKKLGYIK